MYHSAWGLEYGKAGFEKYKTEPVSTLFFFRVNMVRLLTFVILAFASIAASFPSAQNGGSLTARKDDKGDPITRLAQAVVPPPPGPLAFTGTQLSNDAAHPFVPLKPNDIRGPCPALNTLASHGVCHLTFFYVSDF